MTVRRAARALLGSWAFEGLGWFALKEASMRLAVEGGFVLGALLLGIGGLVVLAAWLVGHTLLWFFFFGGHEKLGSLAGRTNDVGRIMTFRDEIVHWAQSTPSIRAVVLVGSAARGELSEHSDVDIIVVPGNPFPRGILAIWRLKASAALRGLPLGASTIDVERCLPFRTANETMIPLKASSSPSKRELRTGVIVSCSGIDGAGKTTVAKKLVERLQLARIHAVYFYGHRPFFREGNLTKSGALAFKSIWHHLDRSTDDLRRYPRLALALGLLTFLDYVVVQLRLSRALRPGALLLVDRYVADVIVYLRALGVRRQSVEGLLSAFSASPAVALLFEIDPSEARRRKAEESHDALEAARREYRSLVPLLGLLPIDASGSVDDVCLRALEQVRNAVDLGTA